MSDLLKAVVHEVTREFQDPALKSQTTPADVLMPTRGTPHDSWVRALCVWVYCQKTSFVPHTRNHLNLTSLGRVFNRERSTVRHALARVEGALTRGHPADLDERLQRVLIRVGDAVKPRP